MKIGKILSLAMALGLATTAFAGEQMKMKIAVVEDDGHGDIRIELDSDDIGFNLEELQEGESRSIVDKSGQSIVVTRKADFLNLMKYNYTSISVSPIVITICL